MSAENSGDIQNLIDQARGGSDEAVSNLIESVRMYLLLVANQEVDPRLRQKVAASDIVQDVCLVASERFENFRGNTEGELRAWLRQVLLNSVADARRKYVQSQKRAASREVFLEGDPGLKAEQITPRTSMIAQEEQTQLTDAMDRLSEEYQLVLRLRNWERLSFEDIGKQMQRSENAVQKLWARALKQLERELNLE